MAHTTNVVLTGRYEVLKPVKVLWVGILSTLVMSAFMLLAPFMGLPDMNIPAYLAELTGGYMAAGWALHLAIGMGLAYVYVMFFNHTIPVINNTFRGMLFGILAFMFSQVVLFAVTLSGLLSWGEKESLAVLVFGNCIAHLIYGAVLGSFFSNK